MQKKTFEKFLPLILILLLTAGSIGMEMSAPSLAFIRKYFQTTEKMIGMTITLNFLGFFIMSFFYGPLSDVYGRKKILIIGNIIGAIGAFLCVVAPSIEILLFARFIQGAGVSASMILYSAIISETYNFEKATKLFKINTGIITGLVAVSPVIGGFLNNQIGWRGNYCVVAVVQILGLISIILLFQETNKNLQEKFCYKSTCYNYFSALKNLKFVFSSSISSLLYAAYLVFITYSAFLYIEVFKLNDIKYSLHQAVIICAFSVTSFILGILKSNHHWDKRIVIAGLGIIIAGNFLIMFSANAILTTIIMTLTTIGHAFVAPVLFSKSMFILKEKGVASSMIGIMRTFFIVALTWLTSMLYNGTTFILGVILLCISISILLMLIYLFKAGMFDGQEIEKT